jgi:hypothetical protein
VVGMIISKNWPSEYVTHVHMFLGYVCQQDVEADGWTAVSERMMSV